MKSLSTHISESFINEDAKDDKRIADIISKSNGSETKANMYASNMAKAITDKAKALRRYEAAVLQLGQDHSVTIIFANRAAELGNNIDVAKPIEKKKELLPPASQRPASEQHKTSRQPYQISGRFGGVRSGGPGGTPILPCGSLNFKTGKNKYFNVKENGSSCLEVWKDQESDKIRIVITSGSTPICQIGMQNGFCHDQNHRPLFYGTMIDYIEQENMESLIKLYGSSALCYVYK